MLINNKTGVAIKYIVKVSDPLGKVLMEGELAPGASRGTQLDKTLEPYSVYVGMACEPSTHAIAEVGKPFRNSSTVDILRYRLAFEYGMTYNAGGAGAEEQAAQPR